MFCVQMLEMLRRNYHLNECTCDPDSTECRQFQNLITRHPCEVGDGAFINPTPDDTLITDDYSSYSSSLSEDEPGKQENTDVDMDPISKVIILVTKPNDVKSSSDSLASISSEVSYDSDFSSGSSFVSSALNMDDCWIEINRCRRDRSCDNALTTFEMACSCDVKQYFACVSDAPKCQEARDGLDAFNLVNCGCPETMKHKKRCQFVYDKLFNNPCIDGCQSNNVQSDTALNAKMLPYQDAINKCTESDDVCLDSLVAFSRECHNCSQAECQQATGDFIRHVDPIISHAVLFSDCKRAKNGDGCVDTTSERECGTIVSPVPNCLELPIRCGEILGCQVQFQNFQNHCDPNRCNQDVYSLCRTAYAALFETPIAIKCTCDPNAVDFSECRVFQRRVSENSCVDKSILYYQDPTLEERRDYEICTIRLGSEPKALRVKIGTFIRVPNSEGESSICQCRADRKLGYCHAIPAGQNLSCKETPSTVYNENDSTHRNGICACISGEFICSKPESELSDYQLNNGQTYLFIGYSSSELQYVSEFIGEQVPDAVFHKQLQQLLDNETKVSSKCTLVLIPITTRGNLLFRSVEEESDPNQTSVTCIGSMMHLASMINGRNMPLVTSPVLSVLKIASVDYLDTNSNNPQRLSRSSDSREIWLRIRMKALFSSSL
ncbi:uncharacterized protein [Antedon mediterranea]|uniref:uncharacterized protein isoform X2 n=1 Tax=Antedon mediterranea TaxID=105859 RepID=UPI003AF70B56